MTDGLLEAAAEEKRRGILRVARKHFMTEGYAATGMEAVARDAGVSTATLYAHFPGKADLFNRVIEDASDEFTRRMARVEAAEGDARTRLLGFAVTYADFMADPFVRSVFRLVIAERRRFPATAARFFDRGRDQFGAVLIAAIRSLDAEGRLRVDRPSWAAGQLMGMIEHPVFLAPLVTGDVVTARRSVGQIAEDAVETFLARYGAAPDPQG